MTPEDRMPKEKDPDRPARQPDRVEELKHLVLTSLDDDKAEELIEIPLAGKTSIADYMVIANGRSQRQVAAMADHLAQKLKDSGFGTAKVEGLPTADWVVIDAGDVIVHLFRPEVRSFYNLEKIWAVDLPQSAHLMSGR